MSVTTLYCSKCEKPGTFDVRSSPFHFVCSSCMRDNEVLVFPALFRETAVTGTGEKLLDDTESSCFYHPNKRASVPCDACGRYLCALCDIETAGRHLCPGCVANPTEDTEAEKPANRTTYYDNVALSVAIIPIIIFYLTIFTAPIALYIALRYWNKTQSVLPRGKWRNVLAILIAGLELAGWIAGIGALFYGIFVA